MDLRKAKALPDTKQITIRMEEDTCGALQPMVVVEETSIMVAVVGVPMEEIRQLGTATGCLTFLLPPISPRGICSMPGLLLKLLPEEDKEVMPGLHRALIPPLLHHHAIRHGEGKGAAQ